MRFTVFDIDNKNFNGAVSDKDEVIGRSECTVGSIVGSLKRAKEMKLTERGKERGRITVFANVVTKDKVFEDDKVLVERIKHLLIDFEGKKLKKMDLFGKSDPYFTITKMSQNQQVYRSETIKKNLNPKWKRIKMKSISFCNNNFEERLKFQCYDWDKLSKDDKIGEFEFSVHDLEEKKDFTLLLPSKKKKKSRGTIKGGVKTEYEEKITKKPTDFSKVTFLDYLPGLEINLTVAIDFTASNLNPSKEESLHHFSSEKKNQYYEVIEEIGQILLDYDTDKLVPAYGFGGEGKRTNGVSHCFPLDIKNVECKSIEGIVTAYKKALYDYKLSGPTYFNEIIKKMIVDARGDPVSENNQKYHVLLILTDGSIDDMDNTVEKIVEASELNISIIICGIGKSDFSKMEFLDSDDELLKIKGKIAKRDIVQFVAYEEVKKKGKIAVSKETLAEIPGQILDFFKGKRISPK